MQTFAGFTRFQTLAATKDYPKPPTALAHDGSALTLFFTNKYIFSNHYHCKILIDGAFFICTEQYYMYQKARYFGDLDIAHLILAAKDPKEMKRLGRQVNGFEKSSWDTVSVQVMKTALFHKFVQNDTLRRELFKTVGTTLVEASPMDNYWGVGLSIDNDAIRDPAQWRGQNLLGHLLTTLREHLMIRPEYADEVKEVTAELKAAA
uniref:NADAR domain-containing protein n=1 Tax=Panagrellus redivivus TaxID=6233 RepID=A0A7E4UTY4_PANRE